jgi:hypothetical protein
MGLSSLISSPCRSISFATYGVHLYSSVRIYLPNVPVHHLDSILPPVEVPIPEAVSDNTKSINSLILTSSSYHVDHQ